MACASHTQNTHKRLLSSCNTVTAFEPASRQTVTACEPASRQHNNGSPTDKHKQPMTCNKQARSRGKQMGGRVRVMMKIPKNKKCLRLRTLTRRRICKTISSRAALSRTTQTQNLKKFPTPTPNPGGDGGPSPPGRNPLSEKECSRRNGLSDCAIIVAMMMWHGLGTPVVIIMRLIKKGE